MNRRQARELAASTLSGTGSYTAVYEAARRQFDGMSPIAVVLSAGTEYVREARDIYTYVHALTATIYVRCDVGGEDAAEDLLDALSRAAAVALMAAGFEAISSDAQGGGAQLRNIDGVLYRAETLRLSYSEEI